ncbi:MAG: hypothetical protein HUK15_00005, partial [Bacteroidales bacterium]|nr:hypothetical protein [Bacteroidales bacterium]
QQLAYTDKRDITYENQNLDVSIYHKISEELVKGKYEVSIYLEGNEIGKSSFIIEK